MPAIQTLKKKLRSINSTRKITKAMKTVSAVKFSRLNSVYSAYKGYAKDCAELYSQFADEAQKALPPLRENAPDCYIVLASNKGLCGNFNSEILSFASEFVDKDNTVLIPCGKRAIAYFKEKGKGFEDSFIFSDVPQYSEAEELYRKIIFLRETGKAGNIKIIYPKYTNMMKQTPVCIDVFSDVESGEKLSTDIMLIPDKQTVIKSIGGKIFKSILYSILLENAIGAQAATLMTMRSAFDTASEYSAALEREINRKRQSQVTADVIETSSDY